MINPQLQILAKKFPKKILIRAFSEANSKHLQYLSPNTVTIFSKSSCPYCHDIKDLFDSLSISPSYKSYELNHQEITPEAIQSLQISTRQRTVPNVFIGQTHIGGCDST